MPEVPEDLDVFLRPHCHMKQLVKDIEKEVRISQQATIMLHQLGGLPRHEIHPHCQL